MKLSKTKGGLLPTELDSRDFQLGRIVKLPKIETLPNEMRFSVEYPKDQRETDFCTAMATCGMSELQEDLELAPEFSFAFSKKISGDPDKWGQGIRTALKTHVKYGALAKDLNSNKDIDHLPLNKLRLFNTWSEDEMKYAKSHKKESYFKITGDTDAFDNIRRSLWKFREEKRAVAIGMTFGYSLDEIFLDEVKDGVGHCMYVIGWLNIEDKDYLIVQNSYGINAGKNGIHYISREVINYGDKMFGSYMMIDLDKNKAKDYLSNNIKIDDNWLVYFWKIIIKFFTK